jgi:zinc protease
LEQKDNRVLIVVQPDKAGLQEPDTTALLTAFDRIVSQPVAAYVDKTTEGELLERIPTPGKVVAEKKHPEVGVTEWKLSNGAVVFLKPTDFKASEILFAGSSPGGTSLFDDASYPSAAFTSIAGAGGWGRFSQANLDRQLSGKIVNVSSGIGSTTEGISGYTNWTDIESMLQLVNLVMLEPRYDSAAIKSVLQRTKVQLVNRSASPEAVFQDTVSATLTQYSKRAPLMTSNLLNQIDPRKAFELYKERFADASDFAFIFVGAFNPDSLKPLVEKYLASLPALNRKDTPRDLPEMHPPKGIIKKTVVAGREERTVTVLNFNGSAKESTRQELTDLSIMTQVLNNRLMKRLREELGSTYGVSVGVSRAPKPISTYSISIQFVSEPARREEMIKEVFAAIDSLKRVPPTKDEIHRVVETYIRDREKSRRTNGYWLALLDLHSQSRPFNELLDDSVLTSATPTRIQKAAQKYIDIKQYQEFNLVPRPAE